MSQDKQTYKLGDKVWFRTVAHGDVKCEVMHDTRDDGFDGNLLLRVTSRTHPTYAMGQTISLLTGSFVRPRK